MKELLKNEGVKQLLGIFVAILILDVFIIKNPLISAFIIIFGGVVTMLVFMIFVITRIDKKIDKEK